jgi:group I intron endonuclease
VNKISGIYKIKCLINKKVYVGSSFNITKRIKNHFSRLKNKNHINPHLQASYNKYGKDNFTWEILEQCPVDALLEREQFWMDETRCYDRAVGFNNCVKADRPLGYKHTDENKKRMSELKKGRKLKPEHIAKISKALTGRKHSEETKRKISDSKLGEKNPMFGTKEDEDHKKERMKGCLSVPRWNKGLTKNDDPRILKLASWKNKTTPNALKCKLLNKKTGEIWTADSLAKLANKCPISLPTIHRLKNGTCGKATKQIYELEYES